MFQKMLDEYLASSSWERLSQGSKNVYRVSLNRLRVMGNAMPKSVAVAYAQVGSRSHIDYWAKAIDVVPVSNNEKNKLIAMVKLVYKHHGLGYMVEAIKNYRHERADAHPLTVETVSTMVAKAPANLKHWANHIVLNFWTGMRSEEARNLMWADVGLETIRIIGAKDREEGVVSRALHILPEVRACLEMAKNNSPYVLVNELGRPLNKNNQAEGVAKVYKALGLHPDTHLYDARRGLATEMYRRGFSLRQIADQLGHKDISTTQRYIRLSIEEKALAFNGFEA